MKRGEYITETYLVRRRNVTDRALRYRAVARSPKGPRVCAYCGSRRNVEVDHKNGFEDDNSATNLVWACRRCNTKKGILFARLGKGRKTHQFNPPEAGAVNLAQWVIAHLVRRGESSEMSLSDALTMIHATPDYRRKMFGQQIWAARRARGTDTQVPF